MSLKGWQIREVKKALSATRVRGEKDVLLISFTNRLVLRDLGLTNPLGILDEMWLRSSKAIASKRAEIEMLLEARTQKDFRSRRAEFREDKNGNTKRDK